MNIQIRVWCILVLPLLCGCATVNPARSTAPAKSETPLEEGWHDVVISPPPDRPVIPGGAKWNPIWWFGNMDDPIPPKDYRPNKHFRKCTWFLRNPCHNFNFYVIGIGDKTFVRCGRFPESVANPHGGWNYAVSKYKRLRLPFLSYKSRGFECYFGWRNGGNFGIKMNFLREQPPPTVWPDYQTALGGGTNQPQTHSGTSGQVPETEFSSPK